MGADVVTMAVSAIDGWTTEDNILLDRIKHTKVSNPVVVPAEMGSGIMDVLQGLASVGIEKLSMMPLEEISGKTILAWASTPSLDAPNRQASLQQDPVVGNFATDHSDKQTYGRRSQRYDVGEPDPEYVSLEDLTTLAMNKIEALSIEGLRIQSGMSDKDASSNINPQSIGEISALEGKRVNFNGSLGLEETGGLQFLDVKNSSAGHEDDDDGIMGFVLLFVTLNTLLTTTVIQLNKNERHVHKE